MVSRSPISIGRAEAARQVRPGEADRAGGDLEEPQSDPGAEGGAHELAARQALDLLRRSDLIASFVRAAGLSTASTW